MHVKEILSRIPPARLYHYTTQTGLLGIIRNKEIWASHTQYLNDQQEFRHAVMVAKQELFNMQIDPEHYDKRPLIDEMERALKGIETVNVCVCSFSEVGDVLSQWRAYGGGSAGYSIGLSGAFLRSICEQEKFWLVPCIYDEAQQRALVRQLLEDVLAENLDRAQQDDGEHDLSRLLPDDYVPTAGNLVAYFNRYAPILKHQSFSEEREWRIISRPLACTLERFDYRPGLSMLIPYYRIPLCNDTTGFDLQEIILGPTPNPNESMNAVKGLLRKHKMKSTQIRHSVAPYRNW